MLGSKRGFSLVEILIALAVLVLVAALVFSSLNSFDESQALDVEVQNLTSLIDRARQLTLFSEDSSRWGVHLAEDRAVLFKGTSYSTSSPDNIANSLHSKLKLTNISLNGGGSQMVFKRLSGETDQYGSFRIERKNDNSKFVDLTVEQTGLIK